MRIMARAAHVLGKGGVNVLRLLQIACLRMAGEAQISILRDQKVLVLRRMRGMAGQATVPAGDRSMAEPEFCLFVRMACKADLVALLNEQLRALRRMRIMTGEAHSAREWRVLDGAAILQVGGDAGGAKRVAASGPGQASLLGAAFDHRQHIQPV